MPLILIGTSGYSYPDWKGVFYPEKYPSRKYLEYYMRYFSIVELNMTFYRMPEADQMVKLVQRSKSRLLFTVKMHRSVTHETGSSHIVRRFLNGIEPLIDGGVFQALLLQFPYSFHCNRKNFDYLRGLLDVLDGVPVALEFRNSGWLIEPVVKECRKYSAAICGLDQPDLEDFPGFVEGVPTDIAYFRFHGRRKDTWWRHEHSWERYDYLYRDTELRFWVPVVKKAAERASRVYVFFNNHYRGQAVRNAQMMMAFMADL